MVRSRCTRRLMTALTADSAMHIMHKIADSAVIL